MLSMALVVALVALPTADVPGKLQLRAGERVVLVGDTVIERDQVYGYLETEILRRYPDLPMTFRNLGWSADTPAGRSRCYFDPPEVGFGRLVEQVKACQPTVLVIGYGLAHALEVGEVAGFRGEMTRFLDAVATPEMKLVFLSPVKPMGMRRGSMAKSTVAMVGAYAETVKEIARERSGWFFDLHGLDVSRSKDGITLTPAGYKTLAAALAEALFPAVEEGVIIDGSAITLGTSTVEATLEVEQKVSFEAAPERLPSVREGRYLGVLIKGGPPSNRLFRAAIGEYRFDSGSAASVPAEPMDPEEKEREMARAFRNWTEQLEELRGLVNEKNALYFQRYRPQNITYLLGFRAYEQGQNAKEIEALDPKILELEKKIDELRRPRPVTCVIEKLQ